VEKTSLVGSLRDRFQMRDPRAARLLLFVVIVVAAVSILTALIGSNARRRFEDLDPGEVLRLRCQIIAANLITPEVVLRDGDLYGPLLDAMRAANPSERVFSREFEIVLEILIDTVDGHTFELDALANEWTGPWCFALRNVRYGAFADVDAIRAVVASVWAATP
jgi:hypothetical protein